MASMYRKVYFKDQIVDADQANISIASSAVLYGLSVYTVFPVCVNDNDELITFRIKEHFQRLIDSSKIIGIDTFSHKWDFSKFEEVIKKVLHENEVDHDVYVRASVNVDEQIAGTKSRGASTVLSIFVYQAEPILSPDGCRLKTSVWRRIPDYAIPSRAKVNGAYVNSVLAKQDAVDSGYDDCIFLDVQGHVCELSAANIFIVRQGKLITPNVTSDLLEGINRRTILEIAKEDFGIEVEERTVDLTELYVADEVFACGTSANIAPVVEIDSRIIADRQIGEITKKLQIAHDDIRHGRYNNTRDWLRVV